MSAITPDPCRGSGQNLSAHIRAQREPVFPPAGAGAEHHRPRRVSARLIGKTPGNPSGHDVEFRINGTVRDGGVRASLPLPSYWRRRDACRSRKAGHAWEPRGDPGRAPADRRGSRSWQEVEGIRISRIRAAASGSGGAYPPTNSRQGVCPCSRDIWCRTRTGLSYPCAGVWPNRTMDRPDLPKP